MRMLTSAVVLIIHNLDTMRMRLAIGGRRVGLILRDNIGRWQPAWRGVEAYPGKNGWRVDSGLINRRPCLCRRREK